MTAPALRVLRGRPDDADLAAVAVVLAAVSAPGVPAPARPARPGWVRDRRLHPAGVSTAPR